VQIYFGAIDFLPKIFTDSDLEQVEANPGEAHHIYY